MRGLLVIFLFLLFCSCHSRSGKKKLSFSSVHISQVIATMTDAMLNDVTSPPLAARFFSYATLAGYEVISQNERGFPSMHGLLKGYPHLKKPDTLKGYDPELAALLAMMESAKKMQPSGEIVAAFQQRFLDSCLREGLDEEVLSQSLRYAGAISRSVLAYARTDRYNQISNYPRYSPSEGEGSWYPTPPGFFAPVEPYFNTVRSFTLDTCTQFRPAPPVPFSKETGSPFFHLLQSNYDRSRNLTKEQTEIAAFWDCNPFALQDQGHLLSGRKKISPGAHWLAIAGIACRQSGSGFGKAMEIHTVLSIGLMDGFIACWDEKFRSNRIRPETAIRRYIDASYKPLLQTPPFPEYLSGHSTISSASAVILSHYFGNSFAYRDTVEQRFGLPAREFHSFHAAAMEAGLSRFYGGIHFMDAIDNGRKQGIQVGEWVLRKLKRQ